MSAAEWEQNRGTLAEFFIQADGIWRHERLTEEYERAADNKQKRSISGSKGAARRWQNDNPSPSPSPSSEA